MELLSLNDFKLAQIQPDLLKALSNLSRSHSTEEILELFKSDDSGLAQVQKKFEELSNLSDFELAQIQEKVLELSNLSDSELAKMQEIATKMAQGLQVPEQEVELFATKMIGGDVGNFMQRISQLEKNRARYPNAVTFLAVVLFSILAWMCF